MTRHAKQTLSRIELRKFEHYERQEHVDDDYCVVGFAHSEPVQVALLSPEKHIDLLEAAAERFELDGIALVATARAALAAPDRVVTLKVSAPLAV
ncbi:MAG TPA: hypothetical protein VN758_10240 [Solirubrobacterales bacterium]|nr:hypothetical protein [Solirubrobacterales bacterium]